MVIDEFHHAAGRDVPTHPRPSEAEGAARSHRDTRAGRRHRRPGLLRRPHRRRAAALGRAQRGPALPVPLLRGRRRHRSVGHRVEARGLRRRCELSNLYTGNDAGHRDRPQAAAGQGRRPGADAGSGVLRLASTTPSTWRASSTRPGSRPASVTGATPQPMTGHERSMTCATGRVNVLFTADLFNEGVDLPDVDTVLFLRPTESATIFLQQLGRGLRRAHGQGGAHRARLRRSPSQGVPLRHPVPRDDRCHARRARREIEHGFPFLPSGCQIVLDEQAKEIVLANIRAQVTTPMDPGGRRAARVRQPKPRLIPPGGRARARRRHPRGPRSGPGCVVRPAPHLSGRRTRERAP